MTSIYVSGPVIRRSLPLLNLKRLALDGMAGIAAPDKAYRWLAQTARSLDFELLLPVSDPYLEIALPESFAREIRQRIERADGIVSIFSRTDSSGPVESTMASMMGRRQIIFAANPDIVPRIMRGMPGVLGTFHITDESAFRHIMEEFLRSLYSQGESALSLSSA